MILIVIVIIMIIVVIIVIMIIIIIMILIVIVIIIVIIVVIIIIMIIMIIMIIIIVVILIVIIMIITIIIRILINNDNNIDSDRYNDDSNKIITPSPPTKSFPTKSPRVELSGRLPMKFNGHENFHPLELRVCLSQTLWNRNA